MIDYLYSDETYKIRGAIYEVYKEIGCGFLEAVYQECLEREFKLLGIPFESQQPIDIEYKGDVLKQKYIPDFICFDKIIVEIKAVKELANEHHAQVINYLKASEMELGLLVNFGSYPKADIKRLIYNY
ncbi:GxxExxY protein [Saccharicrinis sp. GN24d3]|uniref:GxxExxY protein n=1 Tax=Saccharicrinis sp. GN24d3 TaxID=3458416 RepID=UPI00403616E3